ncbi:MAG: PAC2 family protein [Dehalococcoidia bacterium]|nr:PAC2 family protein [Dehalococcoidia bacterium]
MEPSNIVFLEQPSLRQPDLVAAFVGWPDAAQVSTGTVSYMIKKLPAVKFAEMKSDDYYDFDKIRPSINVENGMLWPILMPANSLYYWHNPVGPRDLIIFSGIEPQMRWQSYAEVIADMAGYYNAHRVYAVGGLYDRIPHTRETRISGLVNDQVMIELLEQAGIEPISYTGPSSIHGPLLSVCAMRRIPAVSIWGHVPFYIRAESNPMVCFETVKKIITLLALDLDLGDLKRSADSLCGILDRLISENEQMRIFLRSLEEQYDLDGNATGVEPEGSEQIIKDIEDFLRDQRQED